MSLVTVQRSKDSNKKTENEQTSHDKKSATSCIEKKEKSNTINQIENNNLTKIEEQATNFKDLKAIYSSSASKLSSSSSYTAEQAVITSKSETKTSSFLFHRKTVPRNKFSTPSESNLAKSNTATSSIMGYKNFFKRSSLNSIELSTGRGAGANAENSSSTDKKVNEKSSSLWIPLKSDEELQQDENISTKLETTNTKKIHRNLPSKSNSFTSPKSATTLKNTKVPVSSSVSATVAKQFSLETNNGSNRSLNLNTEETMNKYPKGSSHLIEKYFVVKDAALILPRRSSSTNLNKLTSINLVDGMTSSNIKTNTPELTVPVNNISKLLAFKSALAAHNFQNFSNKLGDEVDGTANADDSETKYFLATGDILIHLQYMISLLRPNDTIILAVKLCSYIQERIRYLVIVETADSLSCEESAILGFDLQPMTATLKNDDTEEPPVTTFSCSIGLVSPIYANCELSLDGDGGFKFKSHHSTHIFKPVSIQAMWSAYQYLHKSLENARKHNHYAMAVSPSTIAINNSSSSISAADLASLNSGNSIGASMSSALFKVENSNHEWVKYYSSLINKNKTTEVINEWYQKEERSALREDFTTPYFDCLQLCKEQEETGIKIKEKLREIMISSKDDYGSMSSVHIRQILEKELGLKLDDFKKFVDATIFQFYNQLVECATLILPYLYLGTEWNASNYDSLQTDRVTHILNISSEVDNFFPDTFKYLNIRVLDVEDTDLLKEFDRTNKFIQEAKEQGTSCLVHCKMGVSRSASVVLAYLMKEYNWNYEQAFQFTKQKRNCINPNDGFKQQLATYESILNAHRAKYNLFEPHNSIETFSSSNSNIQAVKINTHSNSVPIENNDCPNGAVKEIVTKTKSSRSISVSPNQSQQLLSTSPISSSNTNFITATTPNTVSITNSSLDQISKKSDNNIHELNEQNSNHNKIQSNHINFLSINPPLLGNKESNSNLESDNTSATSTSISPKPVLVTMRKKQFLTTPSNGNFHQRSKSEQFFKYHTLPSYTQNNLVYTNDNQSCKSLSNTKSTSNEENSDLSFVLPIGTVKRQVESINFKNKSMSQFNETNGNSDIVRYESSTSCEKKSDSNSELHPENYNGSQAKTTTTSPDSKRFKCELLKKSVILCEAPSEPLFLKERILTVLSESDFNRTKKLFEQSEDENLSTDNFKKQDEIERKPLSLQKNARITSSLSFKLFSGEEKSFKSNIPASNEKT